MRKTYIVLLIIAVLALIIYSQRAALSMRIMERAAEKTMATDRIAELQDGLHVFLCGAGGPLPDPKRSGPCVAVIAGQNLFVVDAGTGGVRNLVQAQLPVGKIKKIFLTHFHSDHIDGLGEMAMLRWVNAANTTPLEAIGPSGIRKVVEGFNAAYVQDSVYRNAHHGDTVAPTSGRGLTAKEFPVPAEGQAEIVFEGGKLKVKMFAVDHAPVSPAVGYRFDYKDRSVLISGDTAKSGNLQAMAKGVDLLVHEALAPNLVGVMNRAAGQVGDAIREKITADILDYHASPAEVAEIAAASGAKSLLFYHIVPPLILPGMEAAFLKGVSAAYDGPVIVGVDGTMISMPAGSEEIDVVSGG